MVLQEGEAMVVAVVDLVEVGLVVVDSDVVAITLFVNLASRSVYFQDLLVFCFIFSSHRPFFVL